MRVHTIERVIRLNDIFSNIKNKIKTNFEIDKNSNTDDLNLLIIGINRKDQSVIVRGSVNKSKNRTSFSILALFNNQILKDHNSSNKTIKPLGKTLYNLTKLRKENEKNYVFSNLKIKRIEEKSLLNQLIEIEKEILMNLLDSLQEIYDYNDGLRKYPFSLSDIDGSWEIWYDIYRQYIELLENKFINVKNNSLKVFRNYDFALENAYYQRIADLIISEEEKYSGNSLNNSQNLNEKKLNLKITFVFAHKKKAPLKLIQMLKLLEEVKRFTHLVYKKDFNRYNHIYPQIIFLSLFGFEESVGNYLRNNLYGKLSDTLSILTIPPIENKIWHNYFIHNSLEDSEYRNSQSDINLAKYNNLRRNGAGNKNAIIKMESQYHELIESKKVSDRNAKELNDWADILSIDNCSKLLDVRNSREKIQKITIL
ncbi:MAG: hypothetical protein ACFFEO_16575 [Candidatus Thorarchaeota archaeon]